MADTMSFRRPSSVSTATTVPPSALMISAVARPMPLAAAVMSATRPSKRMFLSSSGGGGRGRPLRLFDAHGGIGLERAPEAELLSHLAYRRQHFLAEEANTARGVGVAHEAVARPEAHDGGPRLLEEVANLGDDRLLRARDDLLIADLILEGGRARIGTPAHRVLDEGLAIRRREAP